MPPPLSRRALLSLAATSPALLAAPAPAWQVRRPALLHEIEGYPSTPSATAGDAVDLHLRCHTREYSLDIFRLGWYQGTGARRMASTIRLRNGTTADIPRNTLQHPLRCRWPSGYRLQIPAEWPSGVYWILLTAASGYQSAIPLVVREKNPSRAILFQLPITTYHAYNNWGGRSLYDFQSPGGRAFRVSLDRPYSLDALTGDRGFFYCDFALVRWLESQGYPVAYCTNLDVRQNRNLAAAYPVFLSPGHDEYWSLEMMDALERAQRRGTHLLFLSADTCHWVVRFEESDTAIACFKEAAIDPGQPPTVRFRDPEIGRPEIGLMGVQNELHCIKPEAPSVTLSGSPSLYRVKQPDHFLFQGTGLREGDGFEAIVGFEWDSLYDGGPDATVLLECDDIHATCRYEDAGDRTLPAQAVCFERAFPGGMTSRVFSSGTIRWSWGLDDFQFDSNRQRARVDARLAQMTRNILGWMGMQPASPIRSL
jgi:hypothetical protein